MSGNQDLLEKYEFTLFSKSFALSPISFGRELYSLAPIKKQPFLAKSSLTLGISKRMILFPVLKIVLVDHKKVLKVCTHLSI